MARKFLPPIIYREQFSQIVFTIKEATRLLWSISPRFTVFIFAFSAFWGLLTFPAFYIEKLILDRIVENIGNPAWREAMLGLGLLVLGRVFIESIRNILSSLLGFFRSHTSRMFSMQLDVLIANKLAKLDALTIENPDFQDRYNKIERESGRRAWGLMHPLTDVPNHIAGFVSTVGILWFLHPLIALGVVLVALPVVLVDKRFIKKEYEMESENASLYRTRGWLAYLLTNTRSFLELRILRLQDFLSRRMGRLNREILKKRYEIYARREVFRLIFLLPGIAYYAVVNVYLVVLAVTRQITVGSYEMFLRALLAAAQNFTGLANSFLEIYENYIYVEDLVWYLNLKPQLSSGGRKRVNGIKEGIELDDVWFRYGEGDWILKGVTAHFGKGERVAIVGENGAGKTTLIKIFARFYDPQKGKVLIDGTDVRKVNYDSYHSKFAILFQNFEQYPFSAQETIGYGDVASLSRLPLVKEAAQKTQIDEFVENLPLKYKNPLYPEFPKGVQPSYGQWQRFGISRILFRKKSEVLILDEPTSNVDPEAEEKIFNELLKISKNKILIFVSQRFSTVRRADKILVVDKGKIIEQGTHEELMAIDGKYAKLFKLQAKGYR